jgi:hypothetical protein
MMMSLMTYIRPFRPFRDILVRNYHVNKNEPPAGNRELVWRITSRPLGHRSK